MVKAVVKLAMSRGSVKGTKAAGVMCSNLLKSPTAWILASTRRICREEKSVRQGDVLLAARRYSKYTHTQVRSGL